MWSRLCGSIVIKSGSFIGNETIFRKDSVLRYFCLFNPNKSSFKALKTQKSNKTESINGNWEKNLIHAKHIKIFFVCLFYVDKFLKCQTEWKNR